MKNAKVVADTLTERGLRIVWAAPKATSCWWTCVPRASPARQPKPRWALRHITINKNAIPNDPEKPFVTSGIRVGTPAMTTRGFKEEEARITAHLVADVLDNPNDEATLAACAQEVAKLTARFPVYQ